MSAPGRHFHIPHPVYGGLVRLDIQNRRALFGIDVSDFEPVIFPVGRNQGAGRNRYGIGPDGRSTGQHPHFLRAFFVWFVHDEIISGFLAVIQMKPPDNLDMAVFPEPQSRFKKPFLQFNKIPALFDSDPTYGIECDRHTNSSVRFIV
ncbi:hypothetical protein SDC9_137469 [bioreactor metagenome]|uniref:Uncharacterized protein n=1 Tax=bioreactor metagenome TaxID=1076179 RepID=A0A645DMM4_9ZZZZ